MSLLPNETMANAGSSFFVRVGETLVTDTIAAQPGDILTLSAGSTNVRVGAATAAAGLDITYNTVVPGINHVEFIGAQGGNPAGGRIDFYTAVADNAAPTLSNLVMSIGATTVGINGPSGLIVKENIHGRSADLSGNLTVSSINGVAYPPANVLSYTNLQPGAIPDATATGPNGFGYVNIPMIGGSNITTVPGGYYTLDGSLQMSASASGYAVSVAINNVGGDTPLYPTIASSNIASGGPLFNQFINFSRTFVAGGSNIQLYIANGGAAGISDTASVSFEPLAITRIG